jgi:hypothetical protein
VHVHAIIPSTFPAASRSRPGGPWHTRRGLRRRRPHRHDAGRQRRGRPGLLLPGAGTSAATPLWAALIALADQYSGRHLGFVNPAIYRIGRSTSYHQAFHDITTGNSTVTLPQGTITDYRASPGWDPVTGWGSPNAQALIALLARYTSP